MKPFLNKFLNIFHFRRQTVFFAVLGAVFVVGLFVHPSATHAAGVTDYVAQALAGLFGIIFQYVLSPILTMILSALTGVAEYNKIITNKTIIDTWGVVRDIVNMFFIFAILLIAFSTILRIHQYEAKQLLPKLVLYAILVNFSLTICGLFIDLAQVFTLTFLNAFANGAVNNFVSVTKILDYNTMNLSTESTMATLGAVLGGYILALILMVVTIVTLGAALLIFLVRIVYLWILSILSPFAFVLPIIPGGQGYASQWWTMFSKQVITGPLLAFFIWLSLTVLANQEGIANDILNASSLTGADVKTTGTVTGSSAASTPDFLINYIIAIAMLFIGLMLTSQMGGAAGKIAGGASNWMQKSGTGLLTGRIGPTPMRWARERYQSYRGQREGIRKESAQRFGQGVSAIQDRQISSRISGLVRGTAGQVTGAITGGRWVAGEKKQARAIKRFEDHKERQGAENAGAMEALVRQKGYGKNETTIRARMSDNISDLEHSVLTTQLIQRNMANAGDVADVNRTVRYLETMPKSFEKFSDSLKAKNLELAWDTIYTDHRTSAKDTDSLKSDWSERKFKSSSMTDRIMTEAGVSIGHSFLEEFVKATQDPEIIRESVEKLTDKAYQAGMAKFDISSLSLDRKIGFAEAKGGYVAGGITAVELEADILNNREKREKFHKKFDYQSQAKRSYWESMYKTGTLPTEKQLNDLFEDEESRKKVILAHEDMVHGLNMSNDYSDEANKKRNTILKAAQSNNYTASGGVKRSAYGLLSDAAKTALKKQKTKLKGKDFSRIDFGGLTKAEQNGLTEVLSEYDNSKLRELAEKKEDIIQAVFDYMKDYIKKNPTTPLAKVYQQKITNGKKDITLSNIKF